MVQPVLAAKGFKPGEDFYLAFSPERVDPGNPQYQTKNIPKVVGGINEDSTRAAVAFYSQVMDTVVPVSSPSVAEMVKLLENTFRAVNIGLVNELALMCHRMGLDVWEVIDAAKTKPFGFMPFYPGPGLGGHCIPIDPFYLSWKAKQYNFEARFIELAGDVNGAMPEFVVQRVIDALNSQKKSLNGSRVHVIGVAYKRDVNDLRESPALDVLELLAHRGAMVSYTDPYVPEFKHAHLDLKSVDEQSMHEGIDCGVIVTDHKAFDYPAMVKNFKLLVDTRNCAEGRDRQEHRPAVMQYTPSRIPGAWIIEISRIHDARGFFAMTWLPNELSERGMNPALAQCNLAFNHKRGTLRGMHFQKAPHAQAKIVRATRGALLDVIVDLRPESPTFKQWDAVELTADNHRMLYMPEGIAHGYITLVDDTEAYYHASTPWAQSSEAGVRWNDPAFAIDWPFEPAVISEKDATWPDFR